MRWFFVILLFVPNLVAADKATRDEMLELFSKFGKCDQILNLQRTKKDKFRKSQIVMQYEIDEEMFTMENIERLHKRLNDYLNAAAKDKWASLTEDELEYLKVKFQENEIDRMHFALSILDDPKQLAAEIAICAVKLSPSD